MTDALVQVRPKLARRHASPIPFGLGLTKPGHYREMLRVMWQTRGHWNYAYKILSKGVCDGCALGTSGLSDWTIDGTHLCLVRLQLLPLNTMTEFAPEALADVERVRSLSPKKLRDLGRLAYPMRRRKGENGFSRVSWDEALSDIGARLREIDPDRFACFVTSRGITNEVYYAAQKAVRALGSPHVDNAARLCHSPSTAAMKRVLGVSASTCSYKDWFGTDVIVFFGSNPANDQPVSMKYLHEAKKLGTRVLTVNTFREPGLERYWVPSNADSALFGTRITDRFFSVNAGGDLAFLYAVQKILIDRGAIDRAFVDAHTVGFDDYAAHLATYSLDDLIARSGATREDVLAFADELARARTGVFVWSMGLTQHTHGTETVEALLCLGLSKGFVGREKCGLMPIRGHSGVQGGAEMGAYANYFPGGKDITEENADALEATWGFRPPVRRGLDTVQMVEAAGRGELDAFYQIGGNFLDTLPQPGLVAESLAKVPLRIHQDIVATHSMLVEPADTVYLLPARTRYEHRGGVTETTTERRVIYSPFIPGHEIGESREEWRIAVDIALAARPELAPALDYEDAAAIRRDIARTIPAYRGIETLEAQGDQFQLGGVRTCEGGDFPLPDGKARFVTTDPPDRARQAGTFRLATRRGKQFNSIVHAERDPITGARRDHVFISPEDMQRLGLAKDARIRLRSAWGSYEGRAFEAAMKPGNVQMHWPEANVLLPPDRVDRGGRVPDYNADVTIEAL